MLNLVSQRHMTRGSDKHVKGMLKEMHDFEMSIPTLTFHLKALLFECGWEEFQE